MIVAGRPLVVCTDFSGQQVFTWDPAEDRWTAHQLENPYGPVEKTMTGGCLLEIGAAVIDGRVVVGGGGYEQPFAQWDLETGAVRTYIRADHGGLAKVSTVELAGRPWFVCGDSSMPATVRLWDAAQRDALIEDEEARNEGYDPEDYLQIEHVAAPLERFGHVDSISGLASGTFRGRSVVVSGGVDGQVMMWDLDEKAPVVQFEPLDTIRGVGLVTVDGQVRVVAAEQRCVTLGDPDTGTWDEPIEMSEDPEAEDDYEDDDEDEGIECMTVGVVAGRPIAVTGSGDGTVCCWDLAGRRLLGEPFAGHDGEVFAVRITELDGRAVALTAGRDSHIRVWHLDQR
ncbi:WD domain-containing protein, G-beta repeat-containing protein [Goodfellowiella coeruleoviolacea]|uniref:WD domain-containing protein, G-beta repeat-containing protein n=1 Tax=Goodfellowiella coeruleoviolacea TaxID=334858 RepID=A0AAE3KJN3_9PSEU|nr:WD domain-containing protein, G-beta repeat-containing protein [Goodfellowiella coeruleoviolacea]